MLTFSALTFVLLPNEAEPAVMVPPPASEFAVRVTKPAPALITPGVSVLTSLRLMPPVPAAVTMPPKSLAIIIMMDPMPADRPVVPVTFTAPDCVMLPVVLIVTSYAARRTPPLSPRLFRGLVCALLIGTGLSMGIGAILAMR